jgi:hypothetical protein
MKAIATIKAKVIGLYQYLITKEAGKKVSVSKVLALAATACAAIIEFKDSLIASGVALPPELLPWIKAVGLVSALIALIRIRNGQNPPAPAK